MKALILAALAVTFAPAQAEAKAVKAKTARISAPGPVAAANRAALREPKSERYLNAVQVYAWSEGAVFRLYAAPGMISDIALEPGEALISVAAGDTIRWIIGDTTSGSGAAKQTHILVKPSEAALRTNLIITTDRRVYLLLLQSSASGAMTAIRWTYRGDGLMALQRHSAGPGARGSEAIAIERLNFAYAIGGDRPLWRPLRAFDDGSQTFIEFPASMLTREAPPLFAIGSSGRAELVNYRVRGRYYIVDRLFDAAELRLGEKRQQVVRIRRTSGSAGKKGRAS